MSMMKSRTFCLTLLLAGVFAFPLQGWTADYPKQPVELVAAGDPGGGLDLHARIIDMAFQQAKLADKPFTIVNKGAGGGNVATAYMVTQKGSPYSLQVNTNRVLLNPLNGTTKHTLKDMTPVVRLTAEYEIWVVRGDSKYKTVQDVIADLKKDPKSLPFGIGTAPPCTDQLNVLIPAKAAGVDVKGLKIVAFRGGTDVGTQILGGHIPIGSTSLSELVALVEAGRLRPLVVSSPQRMDKLPNVPTWKESGLDVVLAHWRGIFGTPDMPKEAYDYWNKKFAQMSQSQAWKDILAKNDLQNAFLTGDKFKAELEKDGVLYKELLGTLGMLK